MSAKAVRCAGCERRIRPHHPDVGVLEVSTGRTRLYHQECGPGAFLAAQEKGGAYLATYRHVELSVN